MPFTFSPALPAVAVGSVDAYIAVVNRIPLLELEQEKTLAHRWLRYQDLQAAQQLVLAHLRVVVRVARAYKGYGLALGDLIQEGNIGLMKAVKRFNPDINVRLVTFALHWIKAEIHEFILRNWRIVKIATTKAQRKLFFKLRSTQQQLSVEEKPADAAAIAESLQVPQKTVTEMKHRLQQADADIEEAYQIADHNADPAKLLETESLAGSYKSQLTDALTELDSRSRDILQQRWLNENSAKMTLRELAEKYRVSIERIRQLEKNALGKLRTVLAA